MAKVEEKSAALIVANVGNIPFTDSLVSSSYQNMLNSIDKDIISQGCGIMVYAANTRIKVLETHKNTPTVTARLNQKGLHIYLYEPMCGYIHQDKKAVFEQFNSGFYSEFGNVPLPKESLGCAELDSILMYIKNNGLTNVTVHTGDYNVEEYYTNYQPYMKLVCDDMFLNTLQIYDRADSYYEKNITTKFLSLNWRFTPARLITAALLTNYDSEISWYYNTDENVLDFSQWATATEIRDASEELFNQISKGIRTLNQNAPMCVDLNCQKAVTVDRCFVHFYPSDVENYSDGSNPVTDNWVFQHLEKYYRKTFVDVVTESRFAQPTSNVSEKTLQAIQFKTPFITVAPPYTLQYMHFMGYKTFSKWWDESYDVCENHIHRMNKIHEIIQYINSLSYSDLNQINIEMKEILKHNFENLINRTVGKKMSDHTHIKESQITEVRFTQGINLLPIGTENHDD